MPRRACRVPSRYHHVAIEENRPGRSAPLHGGGGRKGQNVVMTTPTTSAWAAIASIVLAAVSNIRMVGLQCRRNIRQATYAFYVSMSQFCNMPLRLHLMQSPLTYWRRR